ncbi:phosphatidylinositol N-acetylglucosaminyltransferase [Parastagonospora nodorum]|nr:phosphatidylinositol N-acetylglucosaminyltransferase [Parastagonospora nodorum]KAH5379842.1 phosphatidylinositol N-acetylglucosaminyltransferase [Parastagonospora nodorum]
MTMQDFLRRITAPPAQILRTVQPTPYTASYTVSTRPVPRKLHARLASYVSVFFRVIIGLVTAFGVWTVSGAESVRTENALQSVLGPLKTDQLLESAGRCQWMYTAPCALVIFALVFRRNYTEESLTVLRGLGIQTSTTSSTYLLGPSTRFIPTTSIQDIFIYEAFKGFEVRFYLAVVVEGEEDVVVVFPTLLPRRAILEEVWRGTKKCLWEGKNEGRDVKSEKHEAQS